MVNILKKFSSTNRRRSKKFKILMILGFMIFSLIVLISFFMDDDMYNYYSEKDTSNNGKTIYNMIEDTGRKIYYATTKSKSTKVVKHTGSSMSASEDEVLNAIQQIIGNFDDAWIKGDTPMLENQIAYIKKSLPMMICMHLKYNDIFTSTGLIQNTQESGWNGEPSVPGSNNFFGIKDGGRAQTEYWHGDVVNRHAIEGGQANFCAYPDVATSVMDYGAFLKTNSRYEKAGVFQASGPVEQITRIMNAGYAPGSESMYIGHAEDLINRLKFNRFDELADKVQQALSKSDSSDTDSADENSDEWEPSGGGLQKIKDAGVDVGSINSKRKKVLAEAESLIGTPYVWGGTTVPNKGSDGAYDVSTGGLDCSAYTEHCIMVGTGIDISRTTYTQVGDPHVEAISLEDAKPGDMFQPDTGHTTFFLKNNGNGTVAVIHEPHTGSECKIEPSYRLGDSKFYRVKGIDD